MIIDVHDARTGRHPYHVKGAGDQQHSHHHPLREIRGFRQDPRLKHRCGRLSFQTVQPVRLVARVKSQLRRYTQLGNMNQGSNENIYKCGGLTINDDTKEVFVDDEPSN